MQNVILYALTVLIWGSTWYAITFQLNGTPPLVSVTCRYVVAAIVLIVFLLATKKIKKEHLTPKRLTGMAMQGGLLFSLNYWLFYEGTNFITSGLVAVIFSLITVMNIINQKLFFKINVKPQVVLGSALGLVGITIVFWPEVFGTHSMDEQTIKGILICLAATYVASLGNMGAIYNNKNDIPVLVSTGIGMGFGALCSLMLVLALQVPLFVNVTVPYTLSLLYLALFGSVAAFGCYLVLLKNIGADKAAYSAVLFPIVALILSTLFEEYVWHASTFIGMGLVVAGNILAMTKRENLLGWRRKDVQKLLKK